MKKPVLDTSLKKITQIDFGIFSAQDMKRLSTLELYERNLYDISTPERPPAKFGVLDRKMGTASKSENCETCNEPLSECVGHFGYIKLTLPVFHIGYFKHIITMLQNVCKSCSKILIGEEQRRTFLKRLRNPNLDNIQKKDIVKSLNVLCKKVTRCPHCGDLNGALKKVGALKIIHEKFKKKNTEEEQEFKDSFKVSLEMDPALKQHVNKAQEDLNPLKVLRIFEKIPDEDCEMMGLSETGRPELFIWTALPVPPVCIRPSVHQETTTNEDDLTVLVSEIIEINTKIRAIIEDGAQTSMLMDHWDYLNLQCGMYITSELSGIPSHLQLDLKKIKKGLIQRLKGKNGRFRGNLSGKRVDFSGRTVISPDPNLRIDQVAVPERIAKVLTYPDRVTVFNMEKLRKNIVNGPDVHPGANYIQSANGQKRFLKYGNRHKIAQEIKIGDIVERHLADDDVILFNRQPSLHKLSIMAHRVKVRPWRTLRFNECVCTPYNADFDGDEMNIHVPQTEEAKAEAIHLMGVKNNLVTPRNGEPLIAATQDFITCGYLLSRKDVFFDRSQFSLICSYMYDCEMQIDLPPPAIFVPVRLWTGKQVFSVLMRPNNKSNIKINLETKCRMFDKNLGVNHAGQAMDKSMCSNDGWLVIYNSQLLSGVIDKAIIGDGNKESMFYVAFRDYGQDVAASFMNRLAKLAARFMGNRGFSIGIDDVQATSTLKKTGQTAMEHGYKTCDDLIQQSAEGKLVNQPGSTQEQTLESKISGVLSKIRDELGSKCMTTLNKWNAPLIMSVCGSKGSKINVCQMVACVGQQIINGNRAANGFGDRTLPHFPRHSVSPAAKGFVRNSFYTGLTPTEFFFHAASGREGLVDTAVKTAETGYMQRRLMKALEDLAANYDLSVRNAIGGVVQFCYGDDGLDPASMEGNQVPVELQRNLLHSKATEQDFVTRALLPWEIRSIIKKAFAADANSGVCNDTFLETVSDYVEENVTKVLIRIREKRGLSQGIIEGETDIENSIKFRITERQLRTFIKICIDKFARSRVEPGTSVGALGAQSIGEPGTQMTLKTFHFAGVASMNVTLGVPRIKEIINASKTISTPIIDAVLTKDATGDPDRALLTANIVKWRIQKTFLGDVIKSINEVLSAGECYLRIKVDVEGIRSSQLEVSLDSIKSSICKAPKLKLSENDVWTDHPDAIRVKVAPFSKTGEDGAMFQGIQNLKRLLPKVVIKGINTVNRAVVSKENDEMHLLVEGYGLLDVMGITGVDGTKCRTNHTLEMHKTLGIETARSMIIAEIMNIMEKHGMTIDRRHVMLMADLMTFKGEILGITRTGIAKMRDSVLMLASFEKTTDHLFDASFYGKKDKVEGVSECIIMGIPISIGTGIFKVIQQNRVQDELPPVKNNFLMG